MGSRAVLRSRRDRDRCHLSSLQVSSFTGRGAAVTAASAEINITPESLSSLRFECPNPEKQSRLLQDLNDLRRDRDAPSGQVGLRSMMGISLVRQPQQHPGDWGFWLMVIKKTSLAEVRRQSV